MPLYSGTPLWKQGPKFRTTYGSPVLVKKIKWKRKIQSKFTKSIELSFVDSKMYLLVNNNDDLFNYSFYSEKRNMKETKRFYEVITKFIQIIDKLELNTRIWNK